MTPTKQMMNNKDTQRINDLYNGILDKKILRADFHNEIEKHLSTTPESQEADGEWIEKARNQYNDGNAGLNHFTFSILDNLPKTNDKRIDEKEKKRNHYIREVEEMKCPVDMVLGETLWKTIQQAQVETLKLCIKDLTSLKSPTTTD